MQLLSVVSLPDKYQTTSAFITPFPRVSLFNVWNHWLLSEFKAEAPIVLGKNRTYLEALSLRKLRSSPEVFLKYPDLDLLNLFSVQNCVPYGFFPALSQAESRVRRACCGHTLGTLPPPWKCHHFLLHPPPLGILYIAPPSSTAPPWPFVREYGCEDPPDLMYRREGPLCSTPGYPISFILLSSTVKVLHVILCLVTFMKWIS